MPSRTSPVLDPLLASNEREDDDTQLSAAVLPGVATTLLLFGAGGSALALALGIAPSDVRAWGGAAVAIVALGVSILMRFRRVLEATLFLLVSLAAIVL